MKTQDHEWLNAYSLLMQHLNEKDQIIFNFHRSSQDEYCPSEDVDQIQIGVVEELRQQLGEIDVQLAYLKEETH